MKREYLSLMCCPECRSELTVTGAEDDRRVIQAGSISCVSKECGRIYPIINAVPRFVDNGMYADSFGLQWRSFAKTQLDGSQTKDSQVRWDSEVTWDAGDLEGKTIIEFGSGAGRFMDVVSKMGVKLAIGIDITDAVDASQENLGKRGNCFFIQADFFKLPIKRTSIDFGYSLGVLHHTPNPEKAFYRLVDAVSEKGGVALGLYDISL
ncbi:MAG: methyltransferase domain-containing protein, partial [Elusimicrobiota bacterium]